MDCWMEITVSDCPPVSMIFTDMSSLSPSWSTISWIRGPREVLQALSVVDLIYFRNHLLC